MQSVNYHRLIQIGIGILILIPGIFKLIKPGPFTEYLTQSPVQIPGGVQLFYPITFLEIIGSVLLIFRPIQKPILYAGISAMFMGILAVALISVAIPEGANMFPDQQEMIRLYQGAHPEKALADILPSKIGTVNILFHLLGIALLAAVGYTEWQRQRKAA